MSRFVIVCALLACRAPEPSPPPSAPPSAPPPLAPVDRSVDPCVDFYAFACNGWRAAHPIPPDRTRWSRYSEVEATNRERVRALVADAASQPRGHEDRRIAAYDAACRDEAAIEARGLAPLAPTLAAIDAMTTRTVARTLAALHASLGPVGIGFSVEPDADDVRRPIATLDTGELGLGEPDDYARAGDAATALRATYLAYVARVLAALGDPAVDAARVVALETQLAAAVPPVAARRLANARFHPMAARDVIGFDAEGYLAALGVRDTGRINVAFPGWLAALGRAELPSLRAYLRFHAARAFAAVLPRAIDDAVFDFESRALRGARAQAPRWKRCLALLDRDLGDDVGRRFVARWFPAQRRARMRAMVERIVAAFRAELAATPWLDAATRDAARRKLAQLRFTYGYRDDDRARAELEIRADDPVGNAARARGAALARERAKLGHPTDRDEFFALPQQLDGFGTKALVSVGFTAGFLQPPLFDDPALPFGSAASAGSAGLVAETLDEAVGFGGIGGVIGHEIIHHFDDEGRRYDADGNLAPWWPADAVAAYESRAQCFVDQYSGYTIDDGTHVDGRLTLGENLADNGGLHLAWQAAQPSQSAPVIDGFTPAQRFFLAWAQLRCENMTPEAAHRQVQRDEHAPGRWRVNGVLANLPAMATAFACPAGAPMAPTTRCQVW